MIIIVDIGNTNQAFYLVKEQNGEVIEKSLIPTHSESSVNDIENLLNSWKVNIAVISSVVPNAYAILETCLFNKGIKIYKVGDDNIKLPTLNIKHDMISLIGADLLSSSIGSRLLYENELLCIIDAGTAITIHLVSSSGEFLGCAITSGIGMSLNALSEKTALLPKTKIEYLDNLIYLDTEKCMQSGMYWGYLGLIEGLIKKAKQDYPNLKRVLLTGGDAKIFCQHLDNVEYVEDLIIKGLYAVYLKNKDNN